MFSQYDHWKLMSPEDESPLWNDENEECPFCGAFPGHGCLLENCDDCDGKAGDPPCVVAGLKREERDPDAERQQAEDDRMDREQDR